MKFVEEPFRGFRFDAGDSKVKLKLNVLKKDLRPKSSSASKIDQTAISEKSVHFVSLGCSKNLVDTEVMLGKLKQGGYELVEDPQTAKTVVINTCSFLTAAVEESISHILDYAQLKKTGVCNKLVVTGCLPQRHRKAMVDGFPEVDLFIGVDEYDHLVDYLESDDNNGEKLHVQRRPYLYDWDTPRVSTTGNICRYVKIAEGCNHACSFLHHSEYPRPPEKSLH